MSKKFFQNFLVQKIETTFKPRSGQVDYTNIRYAPFINCVVRHNDTILIVQRNPKMRLYPNFWNGISGFLDDGGSIEQKVKDELPEELGIGENDIASIHRGPVWESRPRSLLSCGRIMRAREGGSGTYAFSGLECFRHQYVSR